MLKSLHDVSKHLKKGLHANKRQWSTSTAPDKAYAATLLLPKTSFPLRVDPCTHEARFRERTSENLYKWQWENANGPLFVLHDGPPYANGSLHMGHALNKILKDIINRFYVLLGRRVHYVPGWDCHGLPIENKALKEFGVIRRFYLFEFTEHPNDKKFPHIGRPVIVSVQKAEFRKLGIMADWTSDTGSYRTIDHDYEIRQLRVFKALVEKGLVYRRYRPVYYSPASRSALAEAELLYVDDHSSRSVYVAYDCKLDGISELLRKTVGRHSSNLNVKLLVWTTTPWTLPANMGIAVHSDLEYSIVKRHETGEIIVAGRDRLVSLHHVLGETTVLCNVRGHDLLHSRYTSLFHEPGSHVETFPVIHAAHVTSTSGTGLVHCAPAHGTEDYHCFLEHCLLSSAGGRSNGKGQELRCLVGPDGTFSEEGIKGASWLPESVGTRLTGKQVLSDGCAEVINSLKESGKLVKEEKIKHRFPYDWKTNTPVIVTATSQWFADLSNIKTEALELLQTVHFFPDTARARLESFIRNRSEWCISRQRPWGVPIPALHNDTTGEAILTPDSLSHIIQVLEQKGVEHWWNGSVDDFISPALHEVYEQATWIKGGDTMDVWFDSGTSWAGLAESLPPRLEGEHTTTRAIADVCLEGSDQHRGWFQSLLLTAVGYSIKVDGSSSVKKTRESSNENFMMRPYGSIITHGFVLDHEGKKMSKSLGNVISPMTVVEGGEDIKREPAYGADALRLWAATVDYGRDTLIGPIVIQNTVESLRKIRNSARFLLGNLSHSRGHDMRVHIGEMSLTDRYMMFQLYQLEKNAKVAYANYRFPQVAAALDRFVKVTLSSFYLDVTKDTLYADSPDSPRRKSVIWVMNEVLHTMKIVMAPILPHLAEEVHDASKCLSAYSPVGKDPSVFTEGWKSVEEDWNDASAEQDMKQLLTVRRVVMTLLEQARGDKLIKSSLEAAVDVIVPGDLISLTQSRFLELLQEQESHLKTLFIVSDVSILDEGSLGVDAPAWSRAMSMDLEGQDEMLNIRVRPSTGHKCPRCWTYSRAETATLCDRCAEVLN